MLYRDLYTEEIQHREHLRGAVAVPIALLTLVGGAIAYLFKDFSVPGTLFDWWFVIALAGATLSFGVAVVFLIKSYHGHTYERIPFPGHIKRYEDGLRLHFGDSEEGRAQAGSTFEAFLRDCHTRAADRYTETNLKRSAYLYHANGWIITSLVLVALALPPHIARQPEAAARQKTDHARGSFDAPGRTRDSTTAATTPTRAAKEH